MNSYIALPIIRMIKIKIIIAKTQGTASKRNIIFDLWKASDLAFVYSKMFYRVKKISKDYET